MCDTIAATGSATAQGVTLFGKNSDREPNEAQNLCHIIGQHHKPGTSLKCTYISIPQVEKTHTVMLSRPFWMWGAEMGVNEHGLAIGNEAVFTKVPYEKGPGLIGMDLVRLALERGATARQAVDIITDLIAAHGQGGNCGYTNKLFYHNSFLLADPDSVWVLETAGQHWAAKQVDGIYSISNKITIESTWDIASEDLVSFAVEKGWCRSEQDFSFARCYSDFLYTTFSSSQYRRSRTMELLDDSRGALDAHDFFAILRDHGDIPPDSFSPDQGFFRSNICNHASWGPVRVSQTTGSMVSMLATGSSIHFVTGTSAPCTSLFKPVWIDTPVPELSGKISTGKTFDSNSLFWAHEKVHRRAMKNYQQSMQEIIPKRMEREAELVNQALSAMTSDREDRRLIMNKAFKDGDDFDRFCHDAIASIPAAGSAGFLYSRAWKKWNKEARLHEFKK